MKSLVLWKNKSIILKWYYSLIPLVHLYQERLYNNMAESEEKLKSLLMKVKKESEKFGLEPQHLKN